MCVHAGSGASVVSDFLQLYGQEPTRLLCPRYSPGKNTGVGCQSLLKVIFLTQVSNLSLVAPALQVISLPTEAPSIPFHLNLKQTDLWSSHISSLDFYLEFQLWVKVISWAFHLWKARPEDCKGTTALFTDHVNTFPCTPGFRMEAPSLHLQTPGSHYHPPYIFIACSVCGCLAGEHRIEHLEGSDLINSPLNP